MRGLTNIERRALVIDPSDVGEGIPEVVFQELIRVGRGYDTADGYFRTTRLGELALLVCPPEVP